MARKAIPATKRLTVKDGKVEPVKRTTGKKEKGR